jgi:hypothetical protein
VCAGEGDVEETSLFFESLGCREDHVGGDVPVGCAEEMDGGPFEAFCRVYCREHEVVLVEGWPADGA